MVELVDTRDLKSLALKHLGSSPGGCIQTLTKKQSVAYLREQGYRYTEICEILDISLGTARVMAWQARHKESYKSCQRENARRRRAGLGSLKEGKSILTLGDTLNDQN
jgi:transposase